MSAQSEKAILPEAQLAALLRGDAEVTSGWSRNWSASRLAFQIAIIVVGAGLYGAAMGWWRDPHQALFVAIKFPLIILLTTMGNALINGMLAPLLGLNIPFRQSFAAVVMSFAIAAAILAAFSPLIAFMTWNAPPLSVGVNNPQYDLLMLTHVGVIAFAGVTGNLRLFQLLTKLGDGRVVAARVLLGWLTVNLLLGSQLSWNLRPFIGSPDLPVEFFRQTAFKGNFFEAVFHALTQIL